MAEDLNETTTPEEMKQMVESIAAEREGEKAPKSDAQITAELSGKETPAEPTGRDTAVKGEEPAEVEDQGNTGDEPASWIDDSVKAEAAAYGIEESELADFASREELDRALRLFDKRAMEAGRKALAESEGEPSDDKTPVRNDKGQFAKKEEPKQEPPAKVDGRYEISLDTDVYDDGLVEELTRMRDHYHTRLEALEARFLEADARAEEQRFDGFVDKLGHADIFGKTDEETPEQLQRRQDLMVAVKAQQIGLERLGRPTEINEFLVNRVARMVFPEELGKKELKQRTRKIAKQSNGRQGGGATRPQDPREDPRDEFDRLYRELERA